MKEKSLDPSWALLQLQDCILPYWSEQMVDQFRGGFYGRINGQNELEPEADKGVILNTRLLWTFSASYRRLGEIKYLELAHRAYNYLARHFADPVHRGVYWMLDCEGQPLQTKKQVYAQAFTIYALSEYYKVRSESKEVLDWAIELFHLLEQHAFDVERNGYLEALDTSWGRLKDVRLSEKDLNAAKTMNTHLHVLEAYTNLYRVWADEQLGRQLSNLLKLMLCRFVDARDHYRLFFAEDWRLLSDQCSYGHDIEGSWLMTEAAEVLGDEGLMERARKVAIAMVDAALEGLDAAGGLANEGNAKGITDSSKDWWPQAEALVGLVNAWQITDDRNYLTQADVVMNFIERNLLDPKGEWYWGVTREGVPRTDEDKAGPWKCPYHNGRAMLELLDRLP